MFLGSKPPGGLPGDCGCVVLDHEPRSFCCDVTSFVLIVATRGLIFFFFFFFLYIYI